MPPPVEKPVPPVPVIYKADRLPGPDGAVEWYDEPLSDAEAVLRLQQELDIVIRGPLRRENRNKARTIMVASFGGFDEDEHHSGRMALPHFHPKGRAPEVHAFFESPPRHAKKRKP
jgi:hypothetical protein